MAGSRLVSWVMRAVIPSPAVSVAQGASFWKASVVPMPLLLLLSLPSLPLDEVLLAATPVMVNELPAVPCCCAVYTYNISQ
jgi:hypothetical protein